MCNRCLAHFTIHNVKELKEYLTVDDYTGREARKVVKLWFDRGYMDNFIYLEWNSEQEEIRKNL